MGGAAGGADGPNPSWLSQIGAVLKPAMAVKVIRGFESHPRRSDPLKTAWLSGLMVLCSAANLRYETIRISLMAQPCGPRTIAQQSPT